MINFIKRYHTIIRPVPLFPPAHKIVEKLINNTNAYKEYIAMPNQNPYKLEEIQYCSDIHVDHVKKNPEIFPVTNTLIIAGNVGNPYHPNFYKFFKMVSNRFDIVYFTPGNQDLGCTKLYDKYLVSKHSKVIQDIVGLFNNVIMLNNEVYHHNNIVIVGTTLWSLPDVIFDQKSRDHYNEHKKSINFINNAKFLYNNKKIIVVSHYVPTYHLIEEKYYNHPHNCYFVTDLEKYITRPIHTWICGHTHQVNECSINNVNCLINAHGYSNSKVIHTKTFFI